MEIRLWWKGIMFAVGLICCAIEIVNARHIKKGAKIRKVLHKIKLHETQRSAVNKRDEIAGDLEIDGNRFQSVGCFRDAWNRVIPALEGEHQLLMEPNYKARKHALLKCARAAADKRLKIFGIENGGQCFGADDEKSLHKYGMAVECKGDGKGGPWSLQAYRFKDLAIDGAFTEWSGWTTCSKTCGHGVRRRMRTCTNPPPSNGGKDCSGLGPSVEGEICKDKECQTVLVDEAESGNPVQPTLSTTPRNTVVPAAATYRPTIPSMRPGTSKQKEKLSAEDDQTHAQTANQKLDSKGNDHVNNQETSLSEKDDRTQSAAASKVTSVKPTKEEKLSPNQLHEPELSLHKDTHEDSEISPSQEIRPDVHVPASAPFQQINEPQDAKLPHGSVVPAMSQSGNINSHELISEHQVPSGIDPSIVEDTYNGGPVVSSSAVQLNTPLGPVVMGEVSPLSSSSFNRAEQQNDEQQTNECFCPKKVCNARADVGFLVDGSSDIPQVYFAHVLDFIKALARGFDPRDTQVSLVAYGDDAATAFGFSSFKNQHEIDDNIDAVSYMGGDPRTGNALVKVKNGIFQMYSRKDAEHALILMTSGSSADDTSQAAAELRNTGVKVTTVGLGKLANVKELIDISSEPKSSHVFTAFLDTLPDLMDDIIKGVCSDVKGTLADRSDKCACEAKKYPNQEAMHEPSLEATSTLDSAKKLPNNENSQDNSHGPSDITPEHQTNQQENGLLVDKNPKQDSKTSHVSSQTHPNHMKVDQLGLTLVPENSPENKGKQKSPKQQSLESVSKPKGASQETHMSTANQHSPQTDTKPKETKEEATSKEFPETDSNKIESSQESNHLIHQNVDSNANKTKGLSLNSEHLSKNPRPIETGTSNEQTNLQTTGQQSQEGSSSRLKTESKEEAPAPEHNKNEKGVPKEDEKENNSTTNVSIDIKPLKQAEKTPTGQEEAAPEPITQQEHKQETNNVGSDVNRPNTNTKLNENNVKLEPNTTQDKKVQSPENNTSIKPPSSGIKGISKQASKEAGWEQQTTQGVQQNSPLEPANSNSSKNAPPEKILVATQSSSLPVPLNTTKQESNEPELEHHKNKTNYGHPLQSGQETNNSETSQAKMGGKALSPSSEAPQTTVINPPNGQNIDQEKPQPTDQTQYGQPASRKPALASQTLNPTQAGMDRNEPVMQQNGQYSVTGPGEYTDQQPLPQLSDKTPVNKENNQPKPQACSVNLGVVLDSKTTAYGEESNAQKLLQFAKRLTHMFPVSPEGNRVGMMVYSGSPKLKVVHFDHFLDQHTMDKAIDSASFLNMEIKTGRVLNFAQEHLFSRIPSNKQNVLLLITDGVSYDDVTRPALELKRRGVEIFVVGVGRNIVRNELESIASDPADDHVIMMSYDFSDALLEDIKHRICSAAQRKEKITPQSSPLHANCGKADVGFLIDGSRTVEDLGQGNFQKIIGFVKNVSMAFPVSLGKVRIGAVVYGTEPSLEIPFNTINESGGLLAAFDSIRYPGTSSMTGRALEFSRHNLFSYPNTRRGVPKVLVVLTQGSSEDDVRKSSEELHRDGIEVLTVGLGPIYDRVELENMSSLPASEHVMTTDYPDLPSQTEVLRKMICKVTRDEELEI